MQRDISSQYYYRMLKTQKQKLVEHEMQEKTSAYQNDKLEFIKNPIIAELLGLYSRKNLMKADAFLTEKEGKEWSLKNWSHRP